jgi:flagellar protein FlgJ
MAALGDTLAIDVAGAQSLKLAVKPGDREAMRVAAQKFEAMMVGMMLKNMRATHFSEEDDPMTSGEGVELYRDLLDQQWAEQISKGRGLGFADMIVKAYPNLPESGRTTTPADTPAAAPAAATPTTTTPAAPTSLPPQPAAAAAMSGPNAPASRTGGAPGERKQTFLEQMRPHAEVAAATTGVPADFILAHAALESGWGAREIRGTDGTPSHNLFGVKPGSSWEGGRVETLTTEYRQGLPLKMNQQFRAYSGYAEAFTDYANLVKTRYGAAAGTDASGFARALASGGYATDPAYAAKLESVIASVKAT